MAHREETRGGLDSKPHRAHKTKKKAQGASPTRMGLEAEIRELLRELVPRAFAPTDTVDITIAVRDLNMLLRRVTLCYNSRNLYTSVGMRLWGEVLAYIWRNEAALFANGIDVLVEQLDGKAPRAKEREQAKRMQRSIDAQVAELEKEAADHVADGAGPSPLGAPAEVSAFRWPDVDDGEPWFRAEERPQCPMDAVYYHPIAKVKWYSFVTYFLLYDTAIPRGKTLIVDCGALHGRKLRSPVCAHVDKDGVRHVREMNEHPPYWDLAPDNRSVLHRSYEEADDRISYWVYHYAPTGRGMMVITEDGDLLISLMATYRQRAECLAERGLMGRLLMRRTAKVNGKNQIEYVNVDMAAAYLEMFLGGMATSALRHDPAWWERAAPIDGVLTYMLIALMRKNDYSDALDRLVLRNIMRAIQNEPGLLVGLVRVTPPPVMLTPTELLTCNEDALRAYLHTPREVLICFERFRRLVEAGYKQVWQPRKQIRKDGKEVMRADQSPLQAPMPSESLMRGKCARMAWTMDKMVNGGKRGYSIAPELLVDERTGRSLFGYAEVEVTIHDPLARDERDRERRVRIVNDTNTVHTQELYGVRHVRRTDPRE